MRGFGQIWLAPLLALRLVTAAEAGPGVRIAGGLIEGSAAANVVAFKGVPYAALPTGASWQAVSPQGHKAYR